MWGPWNAAWQGPIGVSRKLPNASVMSNVLIFFLFGLWAPELLDSGIITQGGVVRSIEGLSLRLIFCMQVCMHGLYRDSFSGGDDLASEKQGGKNEGSLGREWREGGAVEGFSGTKTSAMYSSGHLFFDYCNDE